MPDLARPNGSIEQNPVLAGTNAYLGPDPFDESEIHKLYGRELVVRRLVSLLSAEQVILLYSPSGAGKTSLLQNRLVPELHGAGFYDVLPTIRAGLPVSDPGSRPNPNRFIANTILALDQARLKWCNNLQGSARTTGLRPYVEELRDLSGNRRSTQVLIFDQFEEVITAGEDTNTVTQFFFELGRVLMNRRVTVVFAFREEWLGEIEQHLPLVTSASPAKVRLELLRHDEARLAIESPAEAGRVRYEERALAHLVATLAQTKVYRPGKVETITGELIEPVQLQVVCYRLWERYVAPARRNGNTDWITITPHDLTTAGNIETILSEFYSDAVSAAAMDPQFPEEAVRDWIEQHLVTSAGLRNQVMLQDEETDGIPTSILRTLEDLRVVRIEQRRGVSWVELTHDLLTQPVVSSNREWEKQQPELWRRARAWRLSTGPKSHLLLSGTQWFRFRRTPGPRSQTEREYLEASRNRILIPAVGLTLVLLGIAVLVIMAVGWREALHTAERLKTEKDRLYEEAERSYWERISEIFDIQTEMRVRESLAVLPETPLFHTQDSLPPITEAPRPVPPKLSLEAEAERREDAASLLTNIRSVSRLDASRILWQTSSATEIGRGLRDTGFSVILGAAQTGVPNAITFGDSVPIDHVRIVGLEMIARGAGLKRVRRFKDSTRAHEIEVVHLDYLQEWPVLSPSYVAGLHFPGKRAEPD